MSSRWTIEDLKKIRPNINIQDFTHQPKNRSIVIDNVEVFKKVKKARGHEEDDLQENCVKAFRLIYPKYKGLLYAIPNGGVRNAIEANRLIRGGVRPGVLDLALDLPSGKWHGMKIEIKTDKGRLSNYQIQYIKDVQDNYYCCVCRSVEQFLKEVKEYLSEEA